jgi:hypothetical protein
MNSSQSGQVGVIVLLIMTVLLTVGLSAAANINRDVSLSRQEGESTRVFDAAEAGIEKALTVDINSFQDTTTATLNTIEDVNVDYRVTKVSTLETVVFEGVSVPIDVSTAVNGDRVRFFWSKTDDCNSATDDPASLLISIFYESAGEMRVRYETASGCDRGDGFGTPDPISISGYRRRATITLKAGDKFLRVKPLYNDTHLRAFGVSWTLPTQGVRVRSQARNENGQETRTVEVNRSLATAPSVMDYAVVSGSDIRK